MLECPPNRLHILAVHGLVVVLEINPASEAADNMLPLLRKAHDDLAAPFVVLRDTDGLTFLRVGNFVSLVDLELNGKTVAVPTEAALAVVAGHGGIPSDNILQYDELYNRVFRNLSERA